VPPSRCALTTPPARAVTLESSVRVKQEIDDKTQGMHLPGEQEEEGFQDLVRDIAKFSGQQVELEKQVRVCKGDTLEYMNRAKKIITKAKGEQHPEAVSLSKTVSMLAARFAEEEKDLIRAKSMEQASQSPDRKSLEEETKKWLQAQGMRLDEWGMTTSSSAGAGDGVENIINTLRNPTMTATMVSSP